MLPAVSMGHILRLRRNFLFLNRGTVEWLPFIDFRCQPEKMYEVWNYLLCLRHRGKSDMESRHSIKHRVTLLTDQRLFGHPGAHGVRFSYGRAILAPLLRYCGQEAWLPVLGISQWLMVLGLGVWWGRGDKSPGMVWEKCATSHRLVWLLGSGAPFKSQRPPPSWNGVAGLQPIFKPPLLPVVGRLLSAMDVTSLL